MKISDEDGAFETREVDKKVELEKTVQVKEGSRASMFCKRVLAYGCISIVLTGTGLGVWS